MYAVGIAQNHPENADGPADETFFFTRDEKHALVDYFDAGEHPETPVVEDHGGGEKHMGNTSTLSYEDARKQKAQYYNIPLDKRLGRVVEALCDQEGNLITVIQLYHEKPRVREIMEEIKKGAKYGLSVGVDAEKLPGGRVRNKRFTHLGLTKMPEYGGDPALSYDPNEPKLFGTWLHHANISYDGIDSVLAKHYLPLPGMYAGQRTRQRLALRQPPREKSETTAAAAVPVSVGASRPRIDPPVFIRANSAVPKSLPTSTPMSATQQPTLDPTPQLATTTTNIPGFPASTPLANTVLLEQQQQQQQIERIRRAELELETLSNREREFIDKLDTSDKTKLTRAKTLQFQLQNLMSEAGVYTDPIKRGKYTNPLLKLDAYIEQVAPIYMNHIDQSDLSEEERNVLKAMMREPDPTKYGAVLAQVGASAQSMGNMRVAETQLQKEKEERKRIEDELKKRDDELANLRKREREFEEGLSLIGRRPTFYNNNSALAPPTPSTPLPLANQESAVPTSVGATRFLGSEISRAEHRVPESRYPDLVPRRHTFRESPAAQTNFAGDIKNILENVASLSERYQKMATTPFDGGLMPGH